MVGGASVYEGCISCLATACKMALNPLAAPKGVKLLCELCQKPAHAQCTRCRVTYYCGEVHQEEDWEAIHEKICPIVTVLRAPQPHAGTEEERQHHLHQQTLRKKHIIDVTLQVGRKFLHEMQYRLAIPAALEALKFLTEVYGGAHIQLTPAYLILAEAAIGLGRLAEADQYLAQAQWSVLKAPECDPGIKSWLHRNLGQLAASKNNLQEARKHFAEDIYQASVAHGVHTIQTAGGYYHLGKAFLRENKPEVSISLHNQVIVIWREHLMGLVHSTAENGGDQSKATDSRTLGASEQAEALQTLHSIRELREQHPHSLQFMASLYHTLALLHCTLKETAKSEEYAKKALELCTSTTDKDTVLNIKELSKVLKI